MKEQFDAVLTKIAPKVVQMLHRDDATGNPRSLDQRWQFVLQEMKMKENLGHLEEAYDLYAPPRGVSAVQRTATPDPTLEKER